LYYRWHHPSKFTDEVDKIYKRLFTHCIGTKGNNIYLLNIPTKNLYIYISTRYEILGRETNLTPPLFIKVPVPSEGREWHVFAMGIDLTSVSMFIRLNVGVVPTVCYFFFVIS
jgi:hypothetical protein